MKTVDKAIGVITVLTNGIYVAWLYTASIGLPGLLLVFAEFMIISLSALFLVNHWKQATHGPPSQPPSGSLDVFLTVVDESLLIFENTLAAAAGIRYGEKKLYVLDDGNRDEVRMLSEKYCAKYLCREDKCDRKAGNLNYGLENSSGDFILVLDADQIVEPEIAEDLLGYFSDDERLALITTRQRFRAPPKDFNHDLLFYEQMQEGKDSSNAAISCGSGVFYRRKALDKVGGFQTWNLVEDLYTSYVFHQNGFRSLYINKPYTTGTAPRDLQVIYKQRGRWALDTLRIMVYRNPFLVKGLTFRQRLNYFEMGWAYIVAAIALPVVFLLPPLTLLFGVYVIRDPATYVLLRAPTMTLILLFYYRLSGNTFSTCQFWASLSPVYLRALVNAFRVRDVRKCTLPEANPKMPVLRKRNIGLILPHITMVAFGITAVMARIFIIDKAVTSFIAINTFWIAIMVFWFTPIIRRELTGCHYCTFEDVMKRQENPKN
jgi:cellulose synthase (UDP-forming)